jgi:D-alanyl-D-alanine carboxypeptidase/D-alanyl-D-alanine-endopeptidase (penicillin-binding protein 4)
VSVRNGTATRTAPAGGEDLATVHSPPVATLIGLANRPSDNYMAEMLLKGIGARFGGHGSTTAGAGVVARTLRGLGVRATVRDGSGLSRGDRVSPRNVVRLLETVQRGTRALPFAASLPVAGRSGTLAPRMRGTAAQGRCRGKTGTLHDVSALSGYCQVGGGHLIVFSLLMNRVNPTPARAIQDRMVVALARYSGQTPG